VDSNNVPERVAVLSSVCRITGTDARRILLIAGERNRISTAVARPRGAKAFDEQALSNRGVTSRRVMSQPLIVSIPHRLGRQEARRRLDSGITRLRPELGIFLSGLNYHWEQDTLNFIASAMWQRITGRIEVLDDAVRVEIDLPWMMQVLRDTITRRVRGRGIALLEKPPGDA
jgi:hypothetical protein